MKKWTIVVVIIMLIICITTLSACGNKAKYIDELNATFNGEFKLAEKAPSDPNSIEGFIYEGGFGGYALNSEDGLTSYSIGGYPDCLDDHHIIYFTTKDDKYEVFGFSIGDSIEKAAGILSEKGYRVQEEFDHGKIMTLSIIGISFFSDNSRGVGNITSIFIRLDITNKQGVMF